MTRHLISRSGHLVVLLALLLTLATTVISVGQANQRALTSVDQPAPVEVASGWDDPTGG